MRKKLIYGILAIIILAVIVIISFILKNSFLAQQIIFEQKGLSVMTNKGEYEGKEIIKIIIENYLRDPIIIRENGFIEKKTKAGDWEEISLFSPDCVWDIVAVVEEIESGQSRIFELEPVIVGCPGVTALGEGVYRALYDYQVGKLAGENLNWEIIRSNEFIIQ